MPHLTLEYSANLPDSIEWPAVLGAVHRALVALDLFQVEDLKSRAVRHGQVLVGDGSMTTAFAHLTVNILSGRAPDVRTAISHRCLEALQEQLAPVGARIRLDITVEVREMDRQSYAKLVLNPTG